MKSPMQCSVSVVIPTYQRPEQLLKAVMRIKACEPCPDEIIVHIDGNDTLTEAVISEVADVKVLRSPEQAGPGGGRNKAIALAKHEIVASFDDDSYPLDQDYFARLLQLFEAYPQAAVMAAAIYHQNETIASDTRQDALVADFVGCGCAYRKSVFQQTNGYVPLPLAYGMEEVDLSLRLHAIDWQVVESRWLRVFHDTKLEHHDRPQVTAASIANQALLAYLRYPIGLWWLGIAQCFSRVIWLIRHQRFLGIVSGILMIPRLIKVNHFYRQTVSSESLQSYISLRRGAVATLAVSAKQREGDL
jgi:GT2 family glycosyltransferase